MVIDTDDIIYIYGAKGAAKSTEVKIEGLKKIHCAGQATRSSLQKSIACNMQESFVQTFNFDLPQFCSPLNCRNVCISFESAKTNYCLLSKDFI